MKMTKRIVAFLAALMLLLTIVPGMAEETKNTITIKNSNAAMTIIDSTFKAYKLFDAIANEDATAVSYKYNADDCVSVAYQDKTGDELIPVLAEMDEDAIRAFADEVYRAVITPTAQQTADAETVVIEVPSAGYYLVTVNVKNVNGAEGKDEVTSRAILVSVYGGNVEATLKVDAPSMTKQIQHNSKAPNSTDTNVDRETGWGTVGDNQIGDVVHYRTITTVCDTTGYTTYDYVIHDTMDAGLTFQNTVTIYVNNENEKKLDAKYITLGKDGSHTFCVTVDILGAVADGKLEAGDELYTYYDAVLNEDALIYDEGHNDNAAYLEYSNNVYDTDSTGETPEVVVYDWTFKYGIAKVDANENALTGAKFVLSEKDDLTVTYEDGKLSSTDGLIGFVSTSDLTITKNPENYIIEAGEAVIKGLDDKTPYYLYEVQEPDGYSKLESPVSFEISCEYNDEGDELFEDNPTATASGPAGSVKEIEMEAAELCTGIVNESGSVLPSTGGVGTTMYYVVGGVLVLAAVALLMLRRRTGK